jgi:putative phosphoesterase
VKLLVLSDTHRNMDGALRIARLALPDALLHLGDHYADAMELRRRLPELPVYAVRGNCDLGGAGETELLLELGGVRLYMTHGHIHGVKSSTAALAARARELGAALALYGHTHIAALRQQPGVWLMNPGQLERDDTRRPAAFGVVNVSNGAFDCQILTLRQMS